jgi:hypothetical protein
VPLVTSSPEVRASLLFCASVHRDILRQGEHAVASDSRRRILLKGHTLRAIRLAIAESETQQHEAALLFSILWLATYEDAADTLIRRPDPSPFRAPMRSRQWLQLYGVLKIRENHWIAIEALIERSGGIEGLTSYGMGWLIS